MGGGAGAFTMIVVGLGHEFPRKTSEERDLCGYGKSPAAPRANHDRKVNNANTTIVAGCQAISIFVARAEEVG